MPNNLLPDSSHALSILRHFFGALLLFSSAISLNAQAEQIYRSVYKGKISSWRVEMTRTLDQSDAKRYTLTSAAKNMFASIKETSEFQLENHTIAPLQYVYDRKVFGRHVTEAIKFDGSAQKAFYTRSDRPQNNAEHALATGLLDPALYQLALQADLANQKNELEYSFIKRKRLETYQFKHVATEELKISNTSYTALVVIREDPDNKKSTKVWVLPDLHYQVGKIQHTDDGDTFEIALVEYESDAPKLQEFYELLGPKSSGK